MMLELLKNVSIGSLVNSLILVALIGVVIARIGVGDKLDALKEKIQQSLLHSDDEKQKSKDVLQQAKKERSEVAQVIKKLEEDSISTIEAFKHSIDKDIEATVLRLENNAQRSLDAKRAKIVNSLQAKTSVRAIEEAGKSLIASLQNQPELHRKFIAEAINKVEELEI